MKSSWLYNGAIGRLSNDYTKNWLQFLFVAEATALKQQISKVYLHILTKEASYHIYTSQWPVTDVAPPPV